MGKVYTDEGDTVVVHMSLKLVNNLHVQADKPWYTTIT